jgi:hypothetical protein
MITEDKKTRHKKSLPGFSHDKHVSGVSRSRIWALFQGAAHDVVKLFAILF